MPQINQLSSVDKVYSGDQVPIFATSQGDARKASMAVILAFMQENISASDDKITQYSAPSVTGFSVQVNDSSSSIWLVITPTAGFAAGTVVLPAKANCADRQEVLVNCTQAVTTLTINGNGSTVTGAPTTLAANGYFRLRFDGVTSTWYRVG